MWAAVYYQLDDATRGDLTKSPFELSRRRKLQLLSIGIFKSTMNSIEAKKSVWSKYMSNLRVTDKYNVEPGCGGGGRGSPIHDPRNKISKAEQDVQQPAPRDRLPHCKTAFGTNRADCTDPLIYECRECREKAKIRLVVTSTMREAIHSFDESLCDKYTKLGISIGRKK